ncbi:hypothetical protein GDO81_009294 [Engystomops pustulosus]|uniref:Uncharacterized protein n=1 Tax=Engystomops pustulosus TaxID=76066 RepID=A0AAV7BPT4_ENGPU|nr:hypothetical protein GDO81_009294 [Engystomops pustulosus]
MTLTFSSCLCKWSRLKTRQQMARSMVAIETLHRGNGAASSRTLCSQECEEEEEEGLVYIVISFVSFIIFIVFDLFLHYMKTLER